MKKISLLFISLAFLTRLQGQGFQRLEVPVTSISNNPLPFAWAGGLNAPQWSSLDLNEDGMLDLYAFDRNGSAHLAFLNTGGVGADKYVFAPDLVSNFPPCQNFVLVRDYNHDGAADLFVSSSDEGIPAMKVFKGKFENNKLTFKRLQFPWLFDVLIVPAGGGFTNLAVNAPELPALDDMDNDGDLDVLSLSSTGSQISYFQNMSLEKGLTTDTLIFQESDDCWGKFFILPYAQSMSLSNNPDQCAFGQFTADGEDIRGVLHGGATLCTFDEDNDGDKEVLYGDLIYSSIIRGKNGGSPDKGWINGQDTTFPSYDIPVSIKDFPATFYLDVDQDGANDLIASPNIGASSWDFEVVWFYKNIQNNEFPVFKLQQKDLFVGGMLDFGTGAQPAFLDYNADGLMDLVVGNFNRWKPNAQNDPFLTLLENVGSATEPALRVVDQNWLNFNQFAAEAFAFAPAFGDLDGDGDLDLLAGERYGRLFYAENIAGSGKPVAFGPIQPNWKGINVGQYATPHVHDLNHDGLPDLIIGERNGNINYLPNLGTPGNPQFHPNPDEAPNNRFLGKINTQEPGYVTGYSAPVVIRFNDTLSYLITGSESGYLEVYTVNRDSLSSGTFKVFSEKFGNLRDGSITRPAFFNLDGDEYLDAVVGNYRGGLSIFKTPFTLGGMVPAREVQSSIALKLFPNPVTDRLTVSLETSVGRSGNWRIFNALGQMMGGRTIKDASLELDVNNYAPGLYFFELYIGNAVAVHRFVKK